MNITYDCDLTKYRSYAYPLFKYNEAISKDHLYTVYENCTYFMKGINLYSFSQSSWRECFTMLRKGG